jgi:hypothetical protein
MSNPAQVINSQFYTAISQPRFLKYYAACGNSRRTALKLYRANIILSQKMYAIIGVFEIILRNSIDRHFAILKGNSWLEDAVQPGGYLDISVGCEESYHSIQESIHKLGLECTHDKLITKLSFGFWAYQFSKKDYAAAGSTLLEIFPNRPFGTNQRAVFKNLVKINEIRNRIAHYEPICFDKNTGIISTAFVSNRYNLVLELLHWLGCNPRRILYGIDSVKSGINAINHLSFNRHLIN